MNFHAYTYGAAVYGGQIHNFEYVEGMTQFVYDYVQDDVRVQGSFTGEEQGGKIVGAWKEQSMKPLMGWTSWQGSAVLNSVAGHGRLLLFGTWTSGTETGRWTIDMAAA
jgi:hypothetical protein